MASHLKFLMCRERTEAQYQQMLLLHVERARVQEQQAAAQVTRLCALFSPPRKLHVCARAATSRDNVTRFVTPTADVNRYRNRMFISCASDRSLTRIASGRERVESCRATRTHTHTRAHTHR